MSRPRRPTNWPPEGKLRDERLIFLAAEPELIRRAAPWWMHVARFQVGHVSSLAAGSSHRSMKKGRMQSYVLAAHRVGSRLNPLELEEVRRTGTVPDDFFDNVEAERRAIGRR